MSSPYSPLTDHARNHLLVMTNRAKELMPFVKVVLEFGGGWKIVECGSAFYVVRNDDIQSVAYSTIEDALRRLKEIANPKDFNLTEGFDFEDEYHVEYTNKNTKVDVNKAGYGEW